MLLEAAPPSLAAISEQRCPRHPPVLPAATESRRPHPSNFSSSPYTSAPTPGAKPPWCRTAPHTAARPVEGLKLPPPPFGCCHSGSWPLPHALHSAACSWQQTPPIHNRQSAWDIRGRLDTCPSRDILCKEARPTTAATHSSWKSAVSHETRDSATRDACRRPAEAAA